MAKHSTGYSTVQVALHWTVVVLVTFQFLAHEGMEEAYRAFRRAEMPTGDDETFAYLHIGVGVTVLLLMLTRLFLRLTRGVPAPPKDDPLPMRLVADGIHWLIYALLILLPLSGSVAWFAGVERAADAHVLFQNILLIAIALHIGGALFQHFVRRSDVLLRMMRPGRP